MCIYSLFWENVVLTIQSTRIIMKMTFLKQLNLCPCKNSYVNASNVMTCKKFLMHSRVTANYIITSVPQLLLVVTLATYNITITSGDESVVDTKWRVLTRFPEFSVYINIFFLLQVIPEEERPTRGQQQLFRAGQPPMYSTSYYPAQIGPSGYPTGGFLPVYASHSQPV